jgi:hypothetical protein
VRAHEQPTRPGLARSEHTEATQDSWQERVDGVLPQGESSNPPPDNQPGHHPETEQDKPDLEAFRARFSKTESAEVDEWAEGGAGPAGNE